MKTFIRLLVLFILFMAGCATANANSLRPVRLQLKWKHQYQFAGYYAAIEKGFYKDLGMDVKLLEANPNETPFDAVSSGKADFGTCTTDILIARSQGHKPVVLANIFQHSPHIIITLEDSGIRFVHDLKGKRIAAEPYAADLYAFLLAEGIKPANIQVEELNFSIEKLIKGEVDAITAYSTDEVFPLQQAGYKLNVLYPSSSGIDFYGDLLFSNEELIKKQPKLVRDFRAASLKGWAYALSNPEEVVNIIYNKYSNRHTLEHLRFEAVATRRLIQPDVVEIGYTNPGRWEHIIASYRAQGFVSENFKIRGLLYNDYKVKRFSIPWRLLTLLVVALVATLSLVLFFYSLNKRLKKEIARGDAVREQLSSSNNDLQALRQELQTKNATLTGVLESMQEIIFSVDSQLCFTSFNNRYAKAIKKLYGKDIKLNDNLMQYVNDDDNKEFLLNNINTALSGKLAVKQFFSGQTRLSKFFEVYFSPILSPDSEVIGVTVLAKDITDIKKHEEELKSLNEDLETHVRERTRQLMDALEEIDDLAYSLSHDLRTPLRGINGFSSLLLDDYADVLDDDAKRHLNSIKKDALHLGEVLDGLHGLSNVARKDLNLSNTNLSIIAKQIVDGLLQNVDNRKIEVVIQDELIEYCDKMLVVVALENLLGNAIKFTGKVEHARIEFGAFPSGSGRTYYVKDNGVGFNMEHVNKLFKNFQRLHRGNDFEGIGIGLATVRRIIIKHGGSIRAESSSVSGAAFYFTLNKHS